MMISMRVITVLSTSVVWDIIETLLLLLADNDVIARRSNVDLCRQLASLFMHTVFGRARVRLGHSQVNPNVVVH